MKLYVVVREDVPPGAWAAQALHAFREFIEHYPDLEKLWYRTSNTIVILGVPSEAHLWELENNKGVLKTTIFREPDWEDSLTAIAFQPGEMSSEYLSHLNSAGKAFRF